jgi:hypothetical protein
MYHDMGLVGFLLTPIVCGLPLDLCRRATSPAGRCCGWN